MRRNCFKQGAIFRAVTAVISMSVEQSLNTRRRNKLLNEAQATMEVGKILGLDFEGKENEVIGKLAELEEKDMERVEGEADDDEADTVGCCTLKVENVEPMPLNILKFDFLGKDSIIYQNEVEVELPVFKAIQQFRTGKSGGNDLFDKLDTNKLNAHLKELMPGLIAKVFRTYNASITLDEMFRSVVAQLRLLCYGLLFVIRNLLWSAMLGSGCKS
ncbi:DNA topoisomerase 1 [Camellia lanceoleosa]|uniref:DNA topoisomerase 1 n=1 Tax=Camellia lanceoleosa TaxID=1840588 RepID=A0ACC0G069_9ERIC|nr:DNA topoisomerase 1 [Camellia lanceoleosa]